MIGASIIVVFIFGWIGPKRKTLIITICPSMSSWAVFLRIYHRPTLLLIFIYSWVLFRSQCMCVLDHKTHISCSHSVIVRTLPNISWPTLRGTSHGNFGQSCRHNRPVWASTLLKLPRNRFDVEVLAGGWWESKDKNESTNWVVF